MEQLPYGANILITSTASNLSDKIPVGGIEFVTSKTVPNTMTFKYEEINGTLVSISTNLTYTLDTAKKTITLSNSNIFGTNTKPYIELHCNKVKIPISFVQKGYLTNKWYTSNVSKDKNEIRVYGYENSWAMVAKEITISWDTDETQQIFYGKNTGSAQTEFYGCYAKYFYLDGKNINSEETTVYAANGQAPSNYYITIPRLNGTSSSLKHGNLTKATKKFYKYFILEFLIRITSGYEVYQHHTRYYVEDKSKTYNNTDFLGKTSEKQFLQSPNGVPLLLTNELNYKWNSNFFYITEKGEYISPSSSHVYIDYFFSSSHCSCDKNTCQTETYCQPYWGCYVDDNGHCYCYYYAEYMTFNCIDTCTDYRICFAHEYSNSLDEWGQECNCYSVYTTLINGKCEKYSDCNFNGCGYNPDDCPDEGGGGGASGCPIYEEGDTYTSINRYANVSGGTVVRADHRYNSEVIASIGYTSLEWVEYKKGNWYYLTWEGGWVHSSRIVNWLTK